MEFFFLIKKHFFVLQIEAKLFFIDFKSIRGSIKPKG